MTSTLRDALDHRLVLHRARSAAYAGDLETAAGLLDGLDQDAAALDLRARIHAQRGEYERADECWARVLELHPDDADATAGRAALARISAGRSVRPVYTPARATAVLAATLLVASTGGVVWASTDGEAPDEPVAATPVAAPGLQREVETLRAERDARADAAAQRKTRLGELAAAFARVPGVRVEQRAEDVRLVFASGLFSADTSLTTAAEARLAEVGRRLKPVKASVTVVGHTVAVPGGRTSGGSVVGYGRAQVAARELAAASGRPLAEFMLVSAEQSEGPFPDAPRNRTVTILLRPV
ncbi:hypothetical protein [Cryptosporangium sp. NPDC048952]|uniref:hypothetical protein n=1 Tax=Cryptosporangium sp. NPDC048952 TaxID=3363961 RepID=UPI00371E7B79